MGVSTDARWSRGGFAVVPVPIWCQGQPVPGTTGARHQKESKRLENEEKRTIKKKEEKMRKPRLNLENSCYHIYNQGVDRMTIFRDRQDNLVWIDLLKDTLEKYNVHVYCFVTMKNHFHVLIETKRANISKVLWYLGYYFARYINQKYGRVGGLFRNRCQSQLIIQEEYFKNVVWYIHNNPVVAGYIKDVNEFNPEIYTSYSDLAGLTKNYSWLSKGRLLNKLGINCGHIYSQGLAGKILKRDFLEYTKIENMFVNLCTE